MFKTDIGMTKSACQKASNNPLNFSLKGIAHNLKDGEGIFGIDHGGSGADAFTALYSQISDEIQVKFRQKFKPEVSPQEVILQLKDHSDFTVNRILYGVASPVHNNESAAGVNVPYAISAAVLSEILPERPKVCLYNDYGLVMERFKAEIAAENQQILQLGNYQSSLDPGVITAIGPGSGLGVGRLIFLPGNKYLLEQIEGSHGRLAVRADRANENLQSGLINWWQKKYGAVNSDTVLCASGLLKLLRYIVDGCKYNLSPTLKMLMDESRDYEPSLAHEDHLSLTEYALENKDEACTKTLHLFIDLLGGFAQNAAFFHGLPSKNYRIYLAGGVISGLLKHPNFLSQFGKSFTDSFIDTKEKKDSDWLNTIQIAILRQPRAEALYGAAIAAACMD